MQKASNPLKSIRTNKNMLKSIIVILIGVIILLIGLVINITEGISSDVYLVALGMIFGGLAISVVSIIGKIKKWF